MRSSFQVAVARRHPTDVNYGIDDDQTRDYLRAITDAGFDLCLHGSYRSTENAAVVRRGGRTARRSGSAGPVGSRQHFLSFDYDTLFAAQEEAGIRYDMSMGFPDRCGPRAGFSYPYFPLRPREEPALRRRRDQPVLMDVTLQGYMGLQARCAPAT